MKSGQGHQGQQKNPFCRYVGYKRKTKEKVAPLQKVVSQDREKTEEPCNFSVRYMSQLYVCVLASSEGFLFVLLRATGKKFVQKFLPPDMIARSALPWVLQGMGYPHFLCMSSCSLFTILTVKNLFLKSNLNLPKSKFLSVWSHFPFSYHCMPL